MNRSLSLSFIGLMIPGLILLNTLGALAQSPARPKPKIEETTAVYRTPPAELPDSTIERRLVELALTSPTYDASKHQNRINELALRNAKSSWLNLLTVSTSYYDQSGTKTAGQATYVLPKYYFTISIPLGIIFSMGSQVKTAREGISLSKDRQEELVRTIRADILGKYKQYKMNKTLIEMQSEMMNDVLVNATQVEENFKKGTIGVEAFIASQKIRNEETIKSLNLRLQQDLLTLEIEKVIGVPLAQVFSPAPLPTLIRPGK